MTTARHAKNPPSLSGRTFWLWHAGLPLALLLAGTVLFRLLPLDLDISAKFYDEKTAGWPVGQSAPWQQLYDFGNHPAFVLSGAGLALLAAGAFLRQAKPWRRAGLFLVLVMLIGPGLITNSLLKEYWGRPRPRMVQTLGGEYAFEPVLTYDATSPGKSFPSGHAAAAFYLTALYFVALHRRWPGWVRWSCLLAGLAFGTLMGMARIVQGGHFASDVLWAAAIVWLVACACARGILRVPERGEFA